MSGIVVTFYSYKGGVGRTMALANVAVLLAQRDRKVLAVDWDLEAPGLERYFGYFAVTTPKGGLLPLLREQHRGSRGHYREHLSRVTGTLGGKPFGLDVLPSGRETDTDYSSTLERFDWEKYFTDGGGEYLEDLRRQWREEYDVVLIDSRTGLSDTGGICTIQLPDVVVAMFTANFQSLYGVRDTMRLAQAARGRLAYDRMHLRVLPVPTRFSGAADTPEAKQWLDRIGDAMAGFYEDWLPKRATPRQASEALRIPQCDPFGFGEKLAVVEEDGTPNRRMTTAYERIAGLIEAAVPDAAKILRLADVTPAAPRPAPAPSDGYEYDLFVSSAPGSVMNDWNEAFISEITSLVAALAGREVRVYHDLSEVRVGDLWQSTVSRPLLRSRVLLALITPPYMSSPWSRLEWATFERREQAAGWDAPLILPVLLRGDAALPDWISRRQYVDGRDLPLRRADLRRPPAARRLLDDIARRLVGLIEGAPAFDPAWTVAQDLPASAIAPPTAPGPSDLAMDADALAALLDKDPRPDVVEAAHRVLPTLRRDRDFAALLILTDALRRHDADDDDAALHQAFALVQTGEYTSAQKRLERLVGRLPPKSEAFAEATALLGRTWQEQFAAAPSKRSPSARKALRASIDAFKRGYQVDRARHLQHGVRLVAMASAGRRHGLATGMANEQTIARTILEQLEEIPESLRSPWHSAASAELQLALGDKAGFVRDSVAFMRHPQRDAESANDFLRALTTVWELDAGIGGDPVVALLQAQALGTKGGNVQVSYTTSTSKMLSTSRATASSSASQTVPLEALFRDSGGRSIVWFKTAMARAASVGTILDASEQRIASCFAVHARSLGLPLDELVVLTAAHVIASRGESRIRPRNGAVAFEVGGKAMTFAVADELWSSPPEALDATVLRLRKQPPGIEGLPLSPRLPSLNTPQRVYLIGHAEGGQLSFSLQDNELLDYDAVVSVRSSRIRVHYRASTAPGTSGSPVFDDDWQVIALHHAQDRALPRLNGKPGTYAACEGIWIQSIVAEVKR